MGVEELGVKELGVEELGEGIGCRGVQVGRNEIECNRGDPSVLLAASQHAGHCGW